MRKYDGFESKNETLKECLKLNLSERQIIINLCKDINHVRNLREYHQCDECRSKRASTRLLNAIFGVKK